ncbi:hypothetical protein [Siminovitchia sp. 179-K 8D1 HS]|uniref:hypothetical protein n=1 Tax=Siminovitchia sp. 179-K 8D1 HS TaxID=3142385 RepID=UPI0039A066EA
MWYEDDFVAGAEEERYRRRRVLVCECREVRGERESEERREREIVCFCKRCRRGY